MRLVLGGSRDVDADAVDRFLDGMFVTWTRQPDEEGFVVIVDGHVGVADIATRWVTDQGVDPRICLVTMRDVWTDEPDSFRKVNEAMMQLDPHQVTVFFRNGRLHDHRHANDLVGRALERDDLPLWTIQTRSVD